MSVRAGPSAARRWPLMPDQRVWPVLTTRPPWTWAIMYAGKSPENRPRGTQYRGPVWLHAGRTWDLDGEQNPLLRAAWAAQAMSPLGEEQSLSLLREGTPWITTGAVVAVMWVTGCHHADQCRRRDGTLCTEWAARDSHHIVLRGVTILPSPVPARGERGWWRLPPEVEETAREQLDAGMHHG